MAEQTFKSPGFFEREIEVISRPLTRNTATPVGVIGPAQKGQAFVPKTVTSVDEFIRELYENAKITILPLNDSLQPSGQSVTLQSMSMGVPVVITKTSGFWDFSSYIDNQNIIFMKNNEIDEWVNKINYLNNNQNLLNKISIQGEEVIKNKFNLESYGDQLSKIINI